MRIHNQALFDPCNLTSTLVLCLQELEAFYTRVYSMENKVPAFPKNYPTSALVGCVDVIDIVQVRIARLNALSLATSVGDLDPQATCPCTVNAKLCAIQRPNVQQHFEENVSNVDPLLTFARAHESCSSYASANACSPACNVIFRVCRHQIAAWRKLMHQLPNALP